LAAGHHSDPILNSLHVVLPASVRPGYGYDYRILTWLPASKLPQGGNFQGGNFLKAATSQ